MKISENFVIQEFVPKEIYAKFGEASLQFIDKRIVDVVQLLRDLTGKAVTVNNWHTGGKYNESGYRTPMTKTGAKYSQHKRGCAADVKVAGMTPKEVVALILKNEKTFMDLGLTTIENTDATPTWTHLDCRWTRLSKIRFVNP